MFITFISGATVTVDPRELRELVEIIADAAKLDSMEKLAFALDLDEGQLHRQLQGDGHFSLTRVVAKLAHQQPSFLRRLAWKMALHYGLPSEARQSALLFLGGIGRRRQLGMSARAAQKRSA